MSLPMHPQDRKLFVKGHMPSLEVLCSYRVALAPLRFGAGLKGKIVDSWAHGLPASGGIVSEGSPFLRCLLPILCHDAAQ